MAVIGTFTIPPDHPSLPGHFPGNPIVPGVVILDHAIALIREATPGHHLAHLPAIRFTHPVRPNDTVQVTHHDGSFTCTVEHQVVARGTLVFAAPS